MATFWVSTSPGRCWRRTPGAQRRVPVRGCDRPRMPSGADAATIAYGARNIPDLDALFSEMARTLRPGGVAVCLEIARPTGRVPSAFYGVWFDKIVPRARRFDLR